ncbi:hypothetical protein SLS62_003812 [Diatrype stigma]|uniref:Uncharacterized protein n=1 Tax=Diatrype stigma TaxID=117547 RepID=A0AAN9YUC0_9PEZI
MPLPLQDGSGSGSGSSGGSDQQRRLHLLQAAKAFCASFAQKSKTPAEIVEAHFSSSSSSSSSSPSSPSDDTTTTTIMAYEHGLPELGLPFVGRAFRGRGGVRAYFETVGACLTYADMRFPAEGEEARESRDDDDGDDGWTVDAAARKVSVKGSAEFTWIATGESWREVFAYVLTFDGGGRGEGEAPKVRTYEVWADTGAAWLASRGELGRVRKEKESGGSG